MAIKIKRIYDLPSKEDGKRILIDRLWPRGMTKEKANIDLWLKDIAPSNELRKMYAHSIEKHEEFTKLYEGELAIDSKHIEAVKLLKSMALNEDLTLLYAAKSTIYNHAVVLLNWLEKK